MTETTTSTPTTVRFGRRQTRGLLLGFSGPRIAAIACAIGIFVPSMFIAGTLGIAATSPLWVALAASAFVRWGGRPVIEALPTVMHYGARHALGQTSFLARPSAPRPTGTMALPGDAAALRFLLDASGAVMVHDPHARTLTAIAHVTHPAFVLLSPDSQAQRVTGWGRDQDVADIEVTPSEWCALETRFLPYANLPHCGCRDRVRPPCPSAA